MVVSTMQFGFVIPFCSKDENLLKFHTSMWQRYAPVSLTDVATQFTTPVDLVFLFATSTEARIRPSLSDALETNIAPFRSFFRDVHYVCKRLDAAENVYPLAPAVTFFDLMLHKERLPHYDCVFYCEADCVPVRANWLAQIVEEMEDSVRRDVWIKGAPAYDAQFGRIVKEIPHRVHMNGNGFFRAMTPSAIRMFREVYDVIRSNYSTTLSKSGNTVRAAENVGGYDVVVFNHMLHHNDWAFVVQFLQHIQWTGFVCNMYRYPIPPTFVVPENCFFLHGQNTQNFLQSGGEGTK